MKVAIIGASGKTGAKLVDEALGRGYRVAAVCREASAAKLEKYFDHQGFTLISAPVVADEKTLTRALAGCDAVVAVLISVRSLKATALVAALVRATAANGVQRLVFTAGEVTAVGDAGEVFTLRQRIMGWIFRPIAWFTPYSLGDMLKASAMVKAHSPWEWTIVRAPTLVDGPPRGYRLCRVSEITGAHRLPREDYAACLLDSLGNPRHHRRLLAVAPAGG